MRWEFQWHWRQRGCCLPAEWRPSARARDSTLLKGQRRDRCVAIGETYACPGTTRPLRGTAWSERQETSAGCSELPRNRAPEPSSCCCSQRGQSLAQHGPAPSIWLEVGAPGSPRCCPVPQPRRWRRQCPLGQGRAAGRVLQSGGAVGEIIFIVLNFSTFCLLLLLFLRVLRACLTHH